MPEGERDTRDPAPEAEREHMLATTLVEDGDVLISAVIEQSAPI